MDTFTQLSLILIIASAISVIMKLLKQPLIMGYIVTGILAGPALFNILHSYETIEAFSKFGISILLFIVGLGLSPKVIREVGKAAVIAGIGQIIFTTIFGLGIALAFGYNLTQSLYIAIALTFSSTIIILKLLTDRKDTQKLYGRLSIGFLLVQDIVATIILLVVSTFSMQSNNYHEIVLITLKGLAIMVAAGVFSIKVIPKVDKFLSSSSELLFIFSVGWGLLIALLFDYIGFSVEIGTLFAGVLLSFAEFSQEVANKLKPLRDFFLVAFFVLLGVKLGINDISAILPQALVFSIFVLVGNPFIVLLILEIMGYSRRVGFMAGLTVAQISEFSLILVLLGVSLGHLDNKILSLVTLVGIITIAGSTYMIIYADQLYKMIKSRIRFFEKPNSKDELSTLINYDIILFGCNRAGYDFSEVLKKSDRPFLAVDYDPEVLQKVKKIGIDAKYGDAEDPEFLEEIGIKNAKMVVSTIPDPDTSEFLLNFVKKNSDNTIVILTSNNSKNALRYYDLGADYVIVHEFVGGMVGAQIVKDWLHGVYQIKEVKDQHINYLAKRRSLDNKKELDKL